jgi:tetratricopeptide (TPR) repeat protein
VKCRIALSLALWVAIRFQPVLAASTNDSGLEQLLQKARSLEARSRTDLAAQVWHQVLIVSPEQPEALTALVRWAQQNGKTAEANVYVQKLRKVNPCSPVPVSAGEPDLARRRSALLTKAAQLGAIQHYEEAMEIYKQIFGSHPPDGGWALAYYQTEAHIPGHADGAIQALRTLAQRYPEVADYRVALGSLLTYRPETRHAGIAELESVDNLSPMGRRAQQIWRQALVWEKQNPAFQADLESYLARYPDP